MQYSTLSPLISESICLTAGFNSRSQASHSLSPIKQWPHARTTRTNRLVAPRSWTIPNLQEFVAFTNFLTLWSKPVVLVRSRQCEFMMASSPLRCESLFIVRQKCLWMKQRSPYLAIFGASIMLIMKSHSAHLLLNWWRSSGWNKQSTTSLCSSESLANLL